MRSMSETNEATEKGTDNDEKSSTLRMFHAEKSSVYNLDASKRFSTHELTKDVDEEAGKSIADEAKLTITYEDASFEVEDKVIVKPVSGFFRDGELVALMGPSGSGKTTLLTMLAAKKTMEYTGTFKINGHERDEALLPRLSGYCPQQEILYPDMTVREAFRFYTLLKVKDCTQEMAEERSNYLLDALQLDLCADTMIGDSRKRGISGGQKRRVHIGKAMTNKPKVLYLDEPTSGLSSTDSFTVGKILRQLADTEQTIIICVIHQPRPALFDLFNHLVLLSSDGRCVYNGPVSQSVEYFKDRGCELPLGENPADYFLDVVTRGSEIDRSDDFAEHYKNEIEPEILKEMKALPDGQTIHEMLGIDEKDAKSQNAKFNRSFGFQFKTLYHMNIKLRLRAWPDMLRKLGIYIAAGTLMGLVFYQASNKVTNKSSPQLQPFYVIVSLWVTMVFCGIFTMESLPKVIDNRILYKFDRIDGIYGTVPYFFAQACSFFVEGVIDVVLMCIPNYFLIGYNYNDAGPFFFYLAVMIMAYWVSEGVLMVLASVSKDAEMANGITVATLAFLLVFSGMLVNPGQSEAWLYWIIYISPYWYGFEALVVNWAKGYNFPPETNGFLNNQQDVYNTFGLNEDMYAWDILIIFGWAVLYRSIAIYGLHYVNNPQI